MKLITWEEAFRDPLFAEGELEITESSKLCRGPIKGIVIDDETVCFQLLWCAHYDDAAKKWMIAERETAIIIDKSKLIMLLAPEGHLILQEIPEVLLGKIFPRGGSSLDPTEVEGLDLNNLPGPEIVDMDVDE